jgi:hypothetical protein
MKKNLLAICSLIVFSVGSIKAQLSGSYNVPGTYTSIAAIISDLNTQGISGPVTVNIAAGYTETAPLGGFTLTATGTLANPIIFQKSGVGSNPLVTAATGGTSVPNSVIQDGIWSFIGSDYITIDGIDLLDPNTTNPATMEYGYALFKASATNGCQNNTIKNCVITLNRVNNAAGAGPAVDGSRGIDVINALNTAHTTNVTITAASGANSNNQFYSNTIQNCNVGISLMGYAAASPFTNADTGNDIGGSSAATGNTIVNFGGGAAVSPAAGIRTLAQYNFNASNNLINNNNGSGVNHAVAIRAINLGLATSANATISNNTLTINSAVTTATVSLIENASGATAANNTITITNNLLANCTNTAATTSPWYGIWNSASCAYLVVTGNTFTNNATKATSGITYLIYNSGAVASSNNLSNNILSFNHNGATAYSGTLYNIYNATSTIATTLTIAGNNFNGYNHALTGTGAIYFIYNGGSSSVYNLNNNLFSNLTLNHSGTEAFMYNLSSTQLLLSVTGNSITNITRTGAAGTTYGYYASAASLGTSSHTLANNLFSNITATVAGSGTFYNWYNSDGSASPYPKKSVFSNTLTNINYSTTGSYYGMYNNYLGDGTSTNGTRIFNNLIDNVTTNGYMYVMYVGATGSPTTPCSVFTNTISNLTTGGAFSNVYANYLFGGTGGLNYYKNKTYNITENGSNGFAYGMYVGGNNCTIYNNLIGGVFTPSATGVTVNGIYIGGGTTSNIFYNSVYLDGTSSAAGFGSNTLYAVTSTNLNLRNNILVNNTVPTSGGLAVVYRRSSTTVSTYSSTSNNNLFYAGTPSASNLIYHDGTTGQQTLGGFQAVVAPRDASSITENPPFITTVGSSPNFLNINSTTPTLIESGAAPIAGITDDYIGTLRNASTPDIGAWEGNYLLNVCSGTPSAGISSISSATGCPNYTFVLTNSGQTAAAGINYQWYSAPSSSGPWTAIPGATASAYASTASQTVTFFQFVVTCTTSAISVTTSPVSFTVVNPGPCVCNNYGSSNATSTADEEILNVTFDALNSTSSCTTIAPGPGSMQNEYSNYAGFLAAPTVTQGQTVSFTVQIGTCGGNYGNSMSIYIDYNQNGLFTDAGEQVYLSSATTVGPHFESGNITIPMNATVGSTRMRVISNETSPASIFPTGTYSWGETEDYCINIVLSSLCSGTPNSGTAAISSPTSCPNTTFTLTGNGLSVASGIAFQWYSSPSASGPWTSIPNATTSVYSTNTSSITFYQLVSTCTVSALSATSSAISYTPVGPCFTMGNTTVTTCSGLLYDSGGPYADYQNNENYTLTLVPSTANAMASYTFNSYNSESNFDYLYIYDGNSTSAPLVGQYTGTVLPAPYTATNSTGILTFKFTSDGSVTKPGFEAMLSCFVPPACSGAPSSGTAAISSASGCPNVSFNLTATGTSTGTGISYQWYSSPSASGPWSAIPGATITAYTTATNSTTYYQMTTTCSVSAMSATTSVVSYSVVNPGPCVCAGYPGSAATSTADEEILNVTFGTLNSTSSCTTVAPGLGSIQNRYSNYSGFLAAPVVLQGQSVPFSFQIGTCGGNYGNAVAAFIDYNQNGVFTDAGEQVYVSSASTTGPHFETGTILIPMTASVGVTRMRIVNVETTLPSSISSTAAYTWGETEDYCVDIQVPQPCAGAPNSGTATINTPTGCVTDPFNLNANGVTNALGITYQWYSAPSASGPWSSITSATNTTYSTTASSVVFFQMVTTCSNSAMSATTSVVSYTPFQCYTMSNTTITSCTGSLYDSGGPMNNYQNNEDYTLTIVPSAANSSVMISFSTFSLESSFDYLYIYDGNSTAAPLIGQYTGFTLPPNAMASNAAGVLTLRFTSDVSVTYAGFSAALTCSNACSGPPSAPVANGSVICSGNSATITAAIATGTAQWFASSTPTNPIASGSVFVTPTLTSNITYYVRDTSMCGSSSLTPVTITVTPLPGVTSVIGGSICSGNSATISAAVTATAQWFATSTPTAALSTNTLYTTPVLNNTTTYYVRDTSSCGASSMTPVTVTVTPTPTVMISASPSTVICAGKTVTLTASGASSYTWNTNAVSPVINATPFSSTVYSFVATSTACPGNYTANISISVNALPSVSLNANGISTICVTNGSIGLHGSPAGGIYSGAAVSGSLLSIANAGTFVPMYSYTSSVTGCVNTATVQVIVINCGTGMGIPQITSTAGLRVYPNPNFGTFTVETGNYMNKAIRLTDLTGRVVYNEATTSDTIQININELANGVYQLMIQSEAGTNIIKVVKQ